jgi:hypothetical protein
MNPFTDYRSPQDEQNRRDRLARVLKDARRTDRTKPGRFWSLVAVAVLLTLAAASTGCSDDSVCRPPVDPPCALDIFPSVPDSELERGRQLVEDGPLKALSEDEEADMRIMLAWFRSLSPSDRKAIKTWLAYQNALNGTGPAYYWESDFGAYITSNDGTSAVGPLR